MLVSFECTVVGQRLRNLSDVRKLQAPKQVRLAAEQGAQHHRRPQPTATHGAAPMPTRRQRAWACFSRVARPGLSPLLALPLLLCPLYCSRCMCTAAASGESCREMRCCQGTSCRSRAAQAQVRHLSSLGAWNVLYSSSVLVLLTAPAYRDLD